MNFDAASHLLDKIRTPKLFMQYAKAKESRGQFKEALDAYRRAKDFDSVVRLLLSHLDRASDAFDLVLLLLSGGHFSLSTESGGLPNLDLPQMFPPKLPKRFGFLPRLNNRFLPLDSSNQIPKNVST